MTESKTPIIHVNMLFQDSWQTVCHLTPTFYAAMSASEHADVRTKAGQRLDLEFLLEWSPYFSSKNESRLGAPEWASFTAMMKPLVAMPPWLAAWYRTIRKMVRIKQRDMESREDAKGDSPLAQMFYAMTGQAPLMDRQMFEAWASQSGHPTNKIKWLSKEMTRILGVRALLPPFSGGVALVHCLLCRLKANRLVQFRRDSMLGVVGANLPTKDIENICLLIACCRPCSSLLQRYMFKGDVVPRGLLLS